MRTILFASVALALAGCSVFSGSDNSMQPPVPVATASSSGSSAPWYWPFGGDSSADNPVAGMPQLGVNSYLWRATLDTLNFMPLASADPVGGIIISDWYAAPEKPDERVKVDVYILDKRLRADALRVTVFRQVRNAAGWADASVNPDTGVKLENAILSRARELRLSTQPQ
ncbi:MAG TPA: DUF3576 domain-containing protein [Micropepsaceae bacterium]|nr:DUF3576 domain-containing protein [Micropepsaceae bacterium]